MNEGNNFIYRLKKLEYLFENLPSAISANLVIVAIIFFTLQNIVDGEYLNLWFGLHILITLLRAVLIFFYKQREINSENINGYYILFFTGVILSALVWGGGAFTIFPKDSEHQMFFILMIGGIISGSTVSLASVVEMFYSYFFISIVPYVYVLSTTQTTINSSIYIAVMFFMLFLSVIARKVSINVDNNILLAHKNRELVLQLEQKIEELNIANRAKSTFLSVMSHEIRTPMNAIIGFIKILIKGEKDAIKLKYLNIVDKSSYLLLGILNDILDISKIESGNFRLQKRVFNPKKEFNNIYELYGQMAKDQNVNIVNSISNKLPSYINSDILRLKQIVSNLLSNAIKFTPEYKQIELIIKFNEENSSLYIEVKDEGVGIDKEDKKRVLEEFIQVDDSINREYSGSGLGLAITNKLLYLFNSELRIESKVGSGSSFSFEIDVEISEAPDEEECSVLEEIDFEEKKVLVAEDNITNQMLMEILLRDMNLDVTIAKDGAEAEKMFKSDNYELILMDINMPNKNGLEAMKAIREYEKNHEAKTPIIALTANSVCGDKENYIEDGFDAYLAKPIENEKLIQLLQKYIL